MLDHKYKSTTLASPPQQVSPVTKITLSFRDACIIGIGFTCGSLVVQMCVLVIIGIIALIFGASLEELTLK